MPPAATRTRRKPRAGSMAMRVLRAARDLYVRGLQGLDRLVAAANPRVGMGQPTSRVFGIGGDDRGSEQELRDLVITMQARCGAASAGAVKSDKAEAAAAPGVRRGAVTLERIDENAAVVHPTS
ncbi:hypothetical protein QOZ80_3BG0266940 [Eleusine coracana subsp. coracana]|nr:hypothetical protein QOZ80_3BG0266940 [Eleusine coracana subsp. coracana]